MSQAAATDPEGLRPSRTGERPARLSDHGLIGNCQIAALVRRDGDIVWACMPRFDSEPVFGALLDEDRGGRFAVNAANFAPGQQRYLENTNVLETRFDGPDGSFRVLDFAPRYIQYHRSFRPTKLVRIVEPLSGMPRIRVACDPVLGWSQQRPRREVGSHHVSFSGYEAEVRLTTNAGLTHLDGEPFTLTRPLSFVLAWGAPVEEPLEALCDRFLRETVAYWRLWVKHCAVPPHYQEEVIRSALALKLHCFEDTGAIVAALTTSLPEAPGAGRNWDYRYCWLRDAFYTLRAFRMVGHFDEREQFLHFLLDVAASTPTLELAPLYRIDGKSDLGEIVVPNWAGYRGESPVRVGNGAAVHLQHDVFGELVLALTPLFLDARFRDQVSEPVLDLVTRLARRAIAVVGQPDAGIWEVRKAWTPQTFSSLMCWAAADRMGRIARVHRPELAVEFSTAASRIHDEILSRAFHRERGVLVAEYDGAEVDASLLQAVTLRFLPPDDPRLIRSVDAIRADLDHLGWLKRYRTDDGLGETTVAFTLCTFWLVEALAMQGRGIEARALMSRVCAARSSLGLISEDVDPVTGLMWGNYPQAYSHVGMIHAAFAASPSWSESGV